MIDLVNWRLAPDLAADSEEENPNLTKYKNVKKYENLEAELGEKNTQVSRIVLYIDDLDRCPPEKVVDVLQAVHLLLAFPLFVVVVGVDARWIKQSLKARYRQMLHTDGQIDPEEIYFGKATPDDYLEKIFQIPFWLKPMDEQSSWQLIQGLLTPAIDDKKKTAPADLSDAPVLGRSEDADEEQEQLTAETAGDARSEEPLATVPETEEGKVEERIPAEEMETESPARESQKAEGEVSDEHAEQMQIKVELAARRLEITEAELKFMEQLSPLLGRSPRALKRFVNVYRLIKVSQPSGTLKAFLNPSVNDGHVLVDSTRDNLGPTPEKNEAEMIADYQSVLFLLAVDTGLPDLAGDFFAALEHEDITGDGKSKEGLKAQLKGLEDKLKLTTASEDRGVLDEQRVKLREWLASNGPDNKNGFLCHATGLRRLSVCAKRVARFSFQAYGTGQPEPDRPLRKTSRKKS